MTEQHAGVGAKVQALHQRVLPFVSAGKVTEDQVARLFSKIIRAPALLDQLTLVTDQAQLCRQVVEVVAAQVILTTPDPEAFIVPSAVIEQSPALRSLLRGADASALPLVVPVSPHAGAVKLVFRYCLADGDKTAAVQQSLTHVDSRTLCELASAAYYLGVQPLVDFATQEIAGIIKDKTPEQVREIFAGASPTLSSAGAAAPDTRDQAGTAPASKPQVPSLAPEESQSSSVTRTDVFMHVQDDPGQVRQPVDELMACISASRQRDGGGNVSDASQDAVESRLEQSERYRRLRSEAERVVGARAKGAARTAAISAVYAALPVDTPSSIVSLLQGLPVRDERLLGALAKLPPAVYALDAYQRPSFTESREQQEHAVSELVATLTKLQAPLASDTDGRFVDKYLHAASDVHSKARGYNQSVHDSNIVEYTKRFTTVFELLACLLPSSVAGIMPVLRSTMQERDATSWAEKNPPGQPLSSLTDVGSLVPLLAEASFGTEQRAVAAAMAQESRHRAVRPVRGLSTSPLLEHHSLPDILHVLSKCQPPSLAPSHDGYADVLDAPRDRYGFASLDVSVCDRFLAGRAVVLRESVRKAAEQAEMKVQFRWSRHHFADAEIHHSGVIESPDPITNYVGPEFLASLRRNVVQ